MTSSVAPKLENSHSKPPRTSSTMESGQTPGNRQQRDQDRDQKSTRTHGSPSPDGGRPWWGVLVGWIRPLETQFLRQQGSVDDPYATHDVPEEVLEMTLITGQEMRACGGHGGSQDVSVLLNELNARQFDHR